MTFVPGSIRLPFADMLDADFYAFYDAADDETSLWGRNDYCFYTWHREESTLM